MGNFVNWVCDCNGKWWFGIGGVMDFCYGMCKVIVVLVYIDKYGNFKILLCCMLLFIGWGCVKVIVIEYVVFDVIDVGLVLCEIFLYVIFDDICVMMVVFFMLVLLL